MENGKGRGKEHDMHLNFPMLHGICTSTHGGTQEDMAGWLALDPYTGYKCKC